MHVVEGSILLPITFFIVFLVLFTSVIFYKDSFHEGRLRRILAQPTTSESYAFPEKDRLVTTLETAPTLTQQGLFQKTLQSDLSLEANGQSPFRFFSLPSEIAMEKKRKAVWSSSTNNLWHYEAINGFAAQMRNGPK